MSVNNNFSVRVVLHGGLGNQLFQFFVGCLETRRNPRSNLLLVTDFLSSYQIARDVEILPLLQAFAMCKAHIAPSDFLTRIRVPKILRYISGNEFIFYVPRYGRIVDGYFQRVRLYDAYNRKHIDAEIKIWRQVLMPLIRTKAPANEHIAHVRLGDFFQSPKHAREYARARLQTLSGPTDLVTDQDDILQEELARLHLPFEVNVVPSATLTAWELLELFCQYSRISTNGSSLAFWSAVLSNASFESSNVDHNDLWRLLTIHS